MLNCSLKKWHNLEEEVQIETGDDLFQKMPKLEVILFVKDFEMKIQHLIMVGKPTLSRIPTPTRSRGHVSLVDRASSSNEGHAIPKSTKKILVDLIILL